MTIKLYKSSAEREEVDKTLKLTLVGTYTFTLTDVNNDVEAPTVRIIDQHNTSPIFPAFNYAYITDFGKYYFKESCQWLGGAVWEISLVEDYLMSWKTQILNKKAVVCRLEDVGGPTMIKDEELIAEATQNADVDYIKITPVLGCIGFDVTNLGVKGNVVMTTMKYDKHPGLLNYLQMTTYSGVPIVLSPVFTPEQTTYSATYTSNENQARFIMSFTNQELEWAFEFQSHSTGEYTTMDRGKGDKTVVAFVSTVTEHFRIAVRKDNLSPWTTYTFAVTRGEPNE